MLRRYGRSLLAAIARVWDFFLSRAGCLSLPRLADAAKEPDRLRASNPDPNQKDQHSADNHLKCGAEKGRIHKPFSDPANEQEFNCDDHNGDGRGGSKIWNQIWQRVTDSSCRGHQPADDSTQQRFAAACQAAVIRSCLSERGVAAISPSNAWAVGSAASGNALDQITFILHWDGTRWQIVPSPSPGTQGLNALYDVDANSANDVWAVGSFTNIDGYIQTLVMHWNGTSWSVIPSANVPGTNNELYGVVALGTNNVWAVRYSGRGGGFSTLVEHLNGSSWSIVSSPNPQGPSILRGVSATGANNIWAVGDERNVFIETRHTLIEHWDGNSWSIIPGVSPIPGPSLLYGVAAVSTGDAWATGFTGAFTLIERSNGSSWSVFPSPNITGRLNAATAITACDVWAAGQRYVENQGFRTLNEHFTCN